MRQSIRSFAVKESKLLDSIGIAPMEEEIQKRVLELTKQNQDSMVEEFGIQSSLTEEDMKQCLQEVINEVQKYKTTTNKTNNGKYIDSRSMAGRKSQIKCALCGKTIVSNEKEKPTEKQRIVEIIDGTRYIFDTNDCVLMFKKFRGVYGSDFI